MSIRILLSLILIGIGIAVMYLVGRSNGGLAGALVGSLFIIMAASLWTLPPGTFERGQAMDPGQRRLVIVLAGLGLGMLGGLAVAIFLPYPLNWLMLAAIATTAVIWWFRRSK